MVDKIQTVSGLISSGIPKVTIQRILLEVAAEGNKFTKDPHFVLPEEFQSTGGAEVDEKPLKVSLTLSVHGYKKRNSKDNFLNSWFNKVDLLSLMKVNVYEITKEKLDQARIYHWLGTHDLNADLTLQEIYSLMQSGNPDLKEINLLEELNSVNSDVDGNTILRKYETTTSDGSIVYNFPIKLEPYEYAKKDPEFLAYMTVVKLDKEALLEHIYSSIPGENDTDWFSSDLEQYISEIEGSYSNIGISYDVVFNKSSVNNVGVLLQRSDNEEFWFGSYHTMPDGSVMTGATHNDTSLPVKSRNLTLVPVMMANTKIVDLRDDEEIEKVLLKELNELENVFDILSKADGQRGVNSTKIKTWFNETPVFSTHHMSKNSSGRHSFILGFDIMKMLLNKSLVAGIANNLHKAYEHVWSEEAGATTAWNTASPIIGQVLNKTEIKYLRIYRKRVDADKFGSNRLGAPNNTDAENYIRTVLNADIENSYSDADAIPKLIAEYSTNGSKINVKKLDGFAWDVPDWQGGPALTIQNKYLFLTFGDSELASIQKGQYQYYYEIVLKDGIRELLEEKLAALLTNYSGLKAYVNFINSNLGRYYNDGTDQFNFDEINADYPEAEIIFAPALASMATILQLFNTDSDTGYISSILLKIAHPVSGNYQGLLKFISIFETFISKIQNISGINTDVLSFKQTTFNGETKWETPIASEGSIVKLTDSNTALQKSSPELRNTFKITEVIPDIADLDNFGRTGYEYLPPSQTPGPGCLDISDLTYMAGTALQLSKHFLTEDELIENVEAGMPGMTGDFGKLDGQYATRYLSPMKVSMPKRTYNLSTAKGAPYPYQHTYSFYKRIILDILQYHAVKSFDQNEESDDLKGSVKKLINIAGRYGVIFDDPLYEQLGFLSDPSPSPTSNTFQDSSGEFDQQQQTSIAYTADSPTASAEDNLSDYNDTIDYTIFLEKLPGLEKLLYGLLSNIILKDSKKLSSEYLLPQSTVGSIIATYPIPIQALFIDHNSTFTSLKNSLRGYGSNIAKSKFRNIPLSLETFGWWWLNYSNIVEVSYVSGYDEFFKPTWKPLTRNEFNNTVGAGHRIICKLVVYENPALNITRKNKFLDLPTLNEHFVITPGAFDFGAANAAIKKAQDDAAAVKAAIAKGYGTPGQVLKNQSMLKDMGEKLGSNVSAYLNTDLVILSGKKYAQTIKTKQLAQIGTPTLTTLEQDDAAAKNEVAKELAASKDKLTQELSVVKEMSDASKQYTF